jgi:osmotically-inducible protein OsmY
MFRDRRTVLAMLLGLLLASPAASQTTPGINRVPRYTTDLTYSTNSRLTASQIQTALERVIENSAPLSKIKGQIRVQVAHDRVVKLSGMVGSERERRMAAAVIQLTPGVGAVDNKLTYPGQP